MDGTHKSRGQDGLLSLKSFTAKGQHLAPFAASSGRSNTVHLAGVDPSQAQYTPFYSEENVYHLISTLLEFDQAKSLDELHVVFISNNVKKVLLWRQRDCPLEERTTGYLPRMYHCVLVQTPTVPEAALLEEVEPQAQAEGALGSASPAPVPSYVWDLDASVPLPCRLSFYAAHALRVAAAEQFSDKFARFYRVVPAAQFLQHFASDRTHMRDAQGAFIKEPPSWPCIVNKAGQASTISKYWDLYPPKVKWFDQDQDCPWGRIFDERDFLDFFHANVVQH